LRRLVGGVFIGAALLAGAIGGLWAYMKAGGAEVDLCGGSDCTSGWYPATAFLGSAVVLGVLGTVVLRHHRGG
jgi:hypothetical protein